MKKVTVFFDLEGGFHIKKPDLGTCLKKILKTLDRYNISASFFTCGIIAETHPRLVRTIHKRGHEIASHGYVHENFAQLTPKETNDVLLKAERSIESVTGERPYGIRFPFLYQRKFTYSVLEKRGYRWASNKDLTRTEVFKSPYYDGFDIKKTANIVAYSLLRIFFNDRPHRVGKLLEIPRNSTPDGQLFGLLSPEQESPKEWLNFAYKTLKTQFDKSNEYFNLNFHPWLIGSANRIILLDAILRYVTSHDIEFILPRELL